MLGTAQIIMKKRQDSPNGESDPRFRSAGRMAHAKPVNRSGRHNAVQRPNECGTDRSIPKFQYMEHRSKKIISDTLAQNTAAKSEQI